jgi:hypothetical protein
MPRRARGQFLTASCELLEVVDGPVDHGGGGPMPHNALGLGPEIGKMLSTYIVEGDQPLVTLVG